MISSRIIMRAFSSSGVVQQLVKPPVQLFGVEGRYATALYSAGSKQKSLEKIEQDLVKLQGMMKTDTTFAEFIRNPSIKRKLKVEAFDAIGKKMSLDPASANLLILMAENGRLDKLNNVINSYKTIMSVYRGEVICEVITAKPLDNDTKSKLESTLKRFLKKGQTLSLTTKVDPSVIGGMLVTIGDKYIDMSVASKVKMYSALIKAPA